MTAKNIEIRAELDERPPMGDVIAEVRFTAPLYPPSRRKAMKLFIRSLIAAYKVRARTEPDIVVVENGEQTVVMRRKAGEKDELRFRGLSPTKAITYCDRRELENLRVLGVLGRAKVKETD